MTETAPGRASGGVTILCYHRVCEGNRWMTPALFAAHLDEIARLARVVDFDEAIHLQDDPRAQAQGDGRPTVCITFDDGWADTLTVALPLLRERKLRATLFVSTGLVDARHEGTAPRTGDMAAPGFEYVSAGRSRHFLTWDELKTLARDGTFDVHAHGHDHAARFGSDRAVSVFDGQLHDTVHHWLREPVILERRLGAPLYGVASTLSRPRMVESQRLQSWSRRVWSTVRALPLAQARMVAALRRLARLPNYRADWEAHDAWQDGVRRDLDTCLDLLDVRCGVQPRYLAWPFGWSHQDSIRIASGRGFLRTAEASAVLERHVPHTPAVPRLFAPSDLTQLRNVLLGRSPRGRLAAYTRASGARVYAAAVHLMEYAPLSMLVPSRALPPEGVLG